MNDIVCLHRPRNNFPNTELAQESWVQDLPLWSTCQREIIITDLVTAEKHRLFSRAAAVNGSQDKVYTGSDAYQFLLEVISGLHSKLIGETEILGQFKTFMSELEKKHTGFYRMHAGFFQGLSTDTKKVREMHLKNLGAQSYGSLVRRCLKAEDSVVLFGGGQLAAEILPWLDKKTKVQVVVRNLAKAQEYFNTVLKSQSHFKLISVEDWQLQKDSEPQAWVMAAPLANEQIHTYLNQTVGVNQIIDLRGENELGFDPASNPVEYLSFANVMQQIESFNSHVKDKTQAALTEIAARTEKFRTLTVYRPQGWDDLWN